MEGLRSQVGAAAQALALQVDDLVMLHQELQAEERAASHTAVARWVVTLASASPPEDVSCAWGAPPVEYPRLLTTPRMASFASLKSNHQSGAETCRRSERAIVGGCRPL
jgi:hypothetical protein